MGQRSTSQLRKRESTVGKRSKGTYLENTIPREPFDIGGMLLDFRAGRCRVKIMICHGQMSETTVEKLEAEVGPSGRLDQNGRKLNVREIG